MLHLIEPYRPAIAELCRKYRVSRLDLFGSATRPDFDPDKSDLDFLVRFDDLNFSDASRRYFGLIEDLERLLGRKVDLVSDRAIRNPYFRQEVDRTRVTLYAA
jgi:uncharacterized protein